MERTGIGRYAIEAANALAAARPSWALDVFTNRPDLVTQRNMRPLATRLPTQRGAARVAWLHAASLLHRRARRADAWFSPAFTLPLWLRAPAVVTVHDLVFLDHADTYSSRARARYVTAATRIAAAKAAGLVCVSAETAARATAAFGTPPAKIRVVHNGVDERFFAPAGAPPAERAAATVLAVGSVEPRKGLDVLLQAVRAINGGGRAGTPVRLVVAGARSWGSDSLLDELRRDPAVDVVPSPSDDALAALYREATVLAFPSRAEGFGLPVAEAMAAGCPVVASDLPSIREFAGEVPVYVPAGDAEQLAAALTCVLDDPAETARRAQLGVQAARALRWSTVGEAVAVMLEEAVA